MIRSSQQRHAESAPDDVESAVEREQMEEFYAVREAAYDALRFGTLVERHRSGVSVLQYLILPSFENPISWDVIKVVSRGEAQTRLYRFTWRMDVDGQAMASPVERMKHPRPYKATLETDWVLVDAKKLEAILSRIGSVRIPLLLASAPGGCDGTSFD